MVPQGPIRAWTNFHASYKFTKENFESIQVPEKKKDWNVQHWDTFKKAKGWKEGKIEGYPVNLEQGFTDAGFSLFILVFHL